MDTSTNETRRIIRLEAGYDNRSTGGGIHGVTMRMVLVGPLGAVHFIVFTGWTPETASIYSPSPAYLGYHSPRPMNDEAESEREECPYLGRPCFHSQSALNAEEPWSILRNEGDEGVWRFLKDYYDGVFAEHLH